MFYKIIDAKLVYIKWSLGYIDIKGNKEANK